MQHSLPRTLPVAEHVALERGHDHAHAAEHAHVHHGVGAAFADRVGAALGFACAVHCVAVPIWLGVLPAVGLGFLADHAFDLAIVGLAAVFALFAARSGWRTHRDGRVVLGFTGAVALLVLGHLIGEESLAGRVPSILGGFALAVSHLANLRLSRRACAHDR